ncbi:hypothetical protein V1478_005416 [Vespula squamosa]|uniref:Uncharacterized protein n=1 Tax=Vespula squamosa TaxID=30214 RepID=A0ABD2BE35_VESSQ
MRVESPVQWLPERPLSEGISEAPRFNGTFFTIAFNALTPFNTLVGLFSSLQFSPTFISRKNDPSVTEEEVKGRSYGLRALEFF